MSTGTGGIDAGMYAGMARASGQERIAVVTSRAEGE